MINSRFDDVLCLIPARSGSKGLVNKNIKEICGKPLLAWTILSAKAVGFKHIIVSTDSPLIAEIAISFGAQVPFLRPAELANDTATRCDVIRHVLKINDGYKYAVYLQPTSPLREAKHIIEAFNLLLSSDANSCVSVVESSISPYWCFSMIDNKIKPLLDFANYPNRQLLPVSYLLNGAIYISSVSHILNASYDDPFLSENVVGYIMSDINSVDIDDENDFILAEKMLKSKLGKNV